MLSLIYEPLNCMYFLWSEQTGQTECAFGQQKFKVQNPVFLQVSFTISMLSKDSIGSIYY